MKGFLLCGLLLAATLPAARVVHVREVKRRIEDNFLAARDHVLELHPTLRLVGAYLGSME